MDFTKDKYGRIIDCMRISITDPCNLRCVYCMPPEGIRPIENRSILSYEEMVRILASLGVTKIRITGGEPLIRRDLLSLIESMSHIEGLPKLSLIFLNLLCPDSLEDP